MILYTDGLVPTVKVLGVNRDLTPPPLDPEARRDPLAWNANWNEFNWYCKPKHLVDDGHGEIELRTMTRAEPDVATAAPELHTGPPCPVSHSTECFETLLAEWSSDLEEIFQ